MELNHQINLALRTAAGHARAASEAEENATKVYEMKMKSAGASVYEAWGLAVRSQPEYQGRQLDDAALQRIFQSNKPRPWWDRHVQAVRINGKEGNREWAHRTMQWHTDPDAARARRAQDNARRIANHAKRNGKIPRQGGRPPQHNGKEPSTRDMRELSKAIRLGEGFDMGAKSFHEAVKPLGMENQHARDSIKRRLERVNLLVSALSHPEQLAEADELVKGLVEAIEEIA